MFQKPFSSKSSIVAALVLLLIFHAANAQEVPGLISRWSFDGDANDRIGINDGTVSGATFVPGMFGQALSFNGTPTDFVTLGFNGFPTYSSPFTIEAWFKTQKTGEQYIIQYGDHTISRGAIISLGTSNGNLMTTQKGANINADFVADGQWFHGAVTFDGTIFRLYVNGDEVTAGAMGVSPFVTNFAFAGAEGTSNLCCYWQGEIDELRLYDRALDASELAIPPTDSPRLVSRWPLDGHADDVVGTSDGTIYGAEFVPGVFGQALSFNGTNTNFVTLGFDDFPTYGSNFTIEGWFRTETLTEQYILQYGHHSQSGGTIVSLGTLDGNLMTTQKGANINADFVADGQWFHGAVTFDGTIFRLYVNGDEVTAGAMGTAPFTTNFARMGAEGLDICCYWNGDIDELRIYDGALSHPGSNPPTADAGPDQAVHTGETVVLDGSASFDDNTPGVSLVYEWNFLTIPDSNSPLLVGATMVFPSFIVNIPGTYSVQLIVTDEDGFTSSPSVVEVSSSNLAPQADAGTDQMVLVGNIVSLDGSSSVDPDGDLLMFDWSITTAPAGSYATLNLANTEFSALVPDVDGTYVMTLVVSDPYISGVPDTVTILASTVEQFAEVQIMNANEVMSNLSPQANQVTTSGNQNAFGNFLIQSMTSIQQGDTAEAIDKLEKAIKRTDGCVLRDSPDRKGPSRDWITDCTAQTEIYKSLIDAVSLLTP